MDRKETNSLIRQYIEQKELYEEYSEVSATLIKTFLINSHIPVYAIERRTKGIDNLREKISRKRVQGRVYKEISDITDLSGVRIIVFFEDDIRRVNDILKGEFQFRRKDLGADTQERKKLLRGYVSVHSLITLKTSRARLSEYTRFKGLVCEVQVMSVLQHAWAEIEHGIGYKPKIRESELERSEIRALFKKNADLVRRVDKNFVDIRKKHAALLADYSAKVEQRKLLLLPVNNETVRTYLRKRLNRSKIPRSVVVGLMQEAFIYSLKNLSELDRYLDKKDTNTNNDSGLVFVQ
jgi:ppGpp synthetase/RelA/SpoT-type nucleotidyltranferase